MALWIMEMMSFSYQKFTSIEIIEHAMNTYQYTLLYNKGTNNP